ncbi:M23 family metallopeptidase [Bacillus sp. FJAT-49736]|uniref:M23 family metallopeptidase n=1 Tax=Bacillus sp. FJAT-49736 TaxID=2833582 RepID=UPI0020161D94|nr:M23 family metallopeptidase [Bacillus sp. FJAT-49736]
MKKIIIHLLMAIFVILMITGGKSYAANLDIKTSTENWYFPAKGEISDLFDTRGGHHKGIDIAGTYKSPVYSVEEGKVVKSYYSPSYGNVVFVHHENGYETVYAHLSNRMVSEGEHVQKGEIVGLMGNSGESTGTHLHFEIHKGEWTIDKKNAINPFIVFGHGELGQLVFALQHDPYGISEVSKPELVEPKKFVFQPFYKVEELSIDLNGNQNVYPNFSQVVYQNTHEKQVTYIVKKGDTLYDIARKMNISLNSIIDLNNLKNVDLIYPKQKLILEKTTIDISTTPGSLMMSDDLNVVTPN